MAGISLREFARRDGCDPKLVRRAVQQGKLKPLANGLLDESLVGTGWRKTNRRNDPTPEPQPAGDKLVPTVTSLQPFADRVLSGDFYPLHDAEKAKENGLALKHLIAARQLSGELVSLELAQNILFESARAERDSWLNWPSKIGPILAAELGLDAERVVEALTPYVHQQLADLGEPDADFSGKR